MTTKNEDFSLLLRIVADEFQVDLSDLSGMSYEQRVCDARHVVASIWATIHTLQDTAARMNRGRHGTVQNSRRRVAILAADDALFAERVTSCLRKIRESAPWILGEPKKSEPKKELYCQTD